MDVEEALRARWCEDGGGPEAEEAMRRAVMANARARRCDEGARARGEWTIGSNGDVVRVCGGV